MICGERIHKKRRNRLQWVTSCKDSFRIIMALVAHYDLELHQMDVKMAFLNRDLYEKYLHGTTQGFVVKRKECMGCHLQKSIYGLKQASR
jgi:hypothetical protein